MKQKQIRIPNIVLECAALTRMTPEEHRFFMNILRRVFTDAHMKAVEGYAVNGVSNERSEPAT